MMSTVQVVDYDARWPDTYDALRRTVWSAIGDVALTVEHVGSTSVPGLAAKPIIDMDVVVPENSVRIGIARLVAIGYIHRGDLGVPRREAFHCPDNTPRHHLYLCPVGSDALRNHLAVRDHLRSHPQVAEAYGALKKALVRSHAHDIDGYVEAKTGFLIGILRSAGLPDTSLAEIEQMNRRRV